MAEALKEMFNAEVVRRIGERVAGSCRTFDCGRFEREVGADLAGLTLLARARRIARGIREGLPKDYPTVVDILLEAMGEPPEWSVGKGGTSAGHDADAAGGMGRFADLPFLNVIGTYGLEQPELSLDALESMTRHFTAEWDVRPFLIHHEALTLRRMNIWAGAVDWRLRRLASEGSRPRLPWGVRLDRFIRDPRPTLALIERLKADRHPNVRNSVANHLNDISRDNPEVALAAAARWARSPDAGTRWIVGHALRTLIKRGDERAIDLLGYSTRAVIELKDLRLKTRRVTLGTGINFSFTLHLRDKTPAELIVDYRIHHCRAGGKRSAKVFKLGRRSLGGGASAAFERRHAIVPISTRRYYAGTHRLEIVVNGKTLGGADFELLESAGSARD